MTCVKTITIQSNPLTTFINCHLEYENQALLRGQEEQSSNLTIVTQKVWSEQKKVNTLSVAVCHTLSTTVNHCHPLSPTQAPTQAPLSQMYLLL